MEASWQGKERSFWLGLALAIATLGLYGLYWNYQAIREVHESFDLEAKGRTFGTPWLVIGLFVGAVFLVYQWRAVGHVRRAREEVGLSRSPHPALFVGLHVVGALTTTLAMLAAFRWAGSLGPFLGIAALGTAPIAVAYGLLQRRINELWAHRRAEAVSFDVVEQASA